MINNPEEEKYRKIRKNNKVFAEKIAPLEGTEEYLEAIGFVKTVVEGDVLYAFKVDQFN